MERVAVPRKCDGDALRQEEAFPLSGVGRTSLLEHSDIALDLCGVRLKLAHPRLRTRASVVVPVLPEEPAHGRQDREWNHDRSEDDERRRLIAGCGNNIRGSLHEIILDRCLPPAFIFSFSNGRFRSGARR